MQAVVCEGKGTDMDGYTLSISRCSGGDGVEESFKAKIKRREAALDAFAVAEAYCKGIGMVSRCEHEGFDGSSSNCAPMRRMRPSDSSGLWPTARRASWMMFSAWNTAVASIRFRHAIGEFIHAFICRI